LLLTIFELVKNGASPIIESAIGQQPKHLALTVGFDLGVLLLGKTSNSIMTFNFIYLIDLCEMVWINEHQDRTTGTKEKSDIITLCLYFSTFSVVEDIHNLIKPKMLPHLYRELAYWCVHICI